jgi:uncharacterized membrane protein
MSDKKQFKDTKVGKLLGKFSGLLPDKGVLSIVKSIIDNDSTLTPEEKESAREAILEAYKAEVSDRDSARQREANVRKYGFDFLFNITGLVILSAFAFLVYVITNAEVPPSNKEIFIHLIGIVEGSVISVVGYYFGTSMKDKNK